MLKKNCSIIIIRTVFLSVTLFFLAYFIVLGNSYMLVFIALVAAVVQVFLVIYEQASTNRQLAAFLDSVRFDDYTVSEMFLCKGRSFRDLGQALDLLSSQFNVERREKEVQLHFNQNLLQNVGVGIVAFDAAGNVAFSNKLFHNMMRVPYCDNLEKIKRFNENLVGHLKMMEPKRKRIFQIEQNGVTLHFLFTASEFVVGGRCIMLVVVQNIQPTIDQAEMEAWQKLIRVLTHEIMNSITPISSLAATAFHVLQGVDEGSVMDQETLSDLREAMQTINRRSDGLVGFVQQYRSLTSVPQPVLAVVAVDELFLRVGLLFRAEFNSAEVEFVKDIRGQNIEIVADSSLIEQVIINLLKNAHHAVENTRGARVCLKAYEDEFQRVVISVSDNGCGIIPEVIDKVFVPFFTTKPDGSGIGLSLSKQIMLMHGGNISVSSVPDKGSEFVLRF